MVVIAHIGGAPGVGKTYLGKTIKRKYKNLKVLDTDKIKDNYIEKPTEENMEIMRKLSRFNPVGKKSKTQTKLEKQYENNYRNYILKTFNKLHDRKEKYLLVGHFFLFEDMFIDIPTNNKICMNVDKNTLFIRRNTRLIKDISKNKKYFAQLIEGGEEFWKYNYLWSFTDLKEVNKQLNQANKQYKKNKYTFIEPDDIIKLIDKEMKGINKN